MGAPVTIHPLAELFPLLDDEELQGLAEDIKAHGQLQPILASRGVVIDGRNRLKACELAGVEPVFLIRDDMTEAEIVAAIISANLRRRHLTTQQRAHIAAELANGSWGGDRSKGPNDPLIKPTTTIKAAASALKVSERSVKRAAQIKRADPEAHQAAIRGERLAGRRTPAADDIDGKASVGARASTALPTRRRTGADLAAAAEHVKADSDAHRATLRELLDIESAYEVGDLLIAVFRHRPYFAQDVANVMLDRARWAKNEKSAPPEREPA
jgi:hypothetical protein